MINEIFTEQKKCDEEDKEDERWAYAAWHLTGMWYSKDQDDSIWRPRILIEEEDSRMMELRVRLKDWIRDSKEGDSTSSDKDLEGLKNKLFDANQL